MSFDESIFESQQRVEQTCKFFCHYSLTDCLFFTELNGEFLVNEDLTVRPRLVNPSVVFICKNCPLPIHNARGEAHNGGGRKATLKTPQKNGRVFFISLTKLC